MPVVQIGLWIFLLGSFAYAAEVTVSRPEHVLEVEARRNKKKFEKSLQQIVVYDKMEYVDGYYHPVKDTVYIFLDR